MPLAPKPAYLPQGLTAAEAEAATTIGGGNRLQGPRRYIGPPQHLIQRRKCRFPAGGDPFPLAASQPFDKPQTKPQAIPPA